MKFTNALWASALLAGAASASAHHRRHAHNHLRRGLAANEAETCLPQCTTYVTSYLVDITEPTKVVEETVVVTPVVEAPQTPDAPVVPLPTPDVVTCPTPGTYTIPATTVVVTETTAVCVPETTEVPAGTHTVGGITTVVETATTIVCPVATVETTDGTVTSVVKTTTFVCPTPGTYTIGPVTTAVPTETVVVYPVVSVVEPGTYCHEDITTIIVQTNVVVTCPLTTVEATATVVPVFETPAPAVPTPVTEEKKAPAPAPEKKKPVVDLAGNDYWSITYSQYNDDHSCKSASDVERDIADIKSKGFSAVRIYSPECGALESVGSACEKYGLKIILGVYIRPDGFVSADKEVKEIIAWGRWDLITLVVIGNETIFKGDCTAEELAAYVKKVSGQFKAAGYTGACTTSETVNVMEQHYSVLCGAIDVVGVNIHPFFDGGISAEEAGPFLQKQLEIVEKLCGKTGYVLEAGWPSEGSDLNAAKANKQAQAAAIKSIASTIPERICFFTYRKDGWKDPGALGVEQSFGCGDLF